MKFWRMQSKITQKQKKVYWHCLIYLLFARIVLCDRKCLFSMLENCHECFRNRKCRNLFWKTSHYQYATVKLHQGSSQRKTCLIHFNRNSNCIFYLKSSPPKIPQKQLLTDFQFEVISNSVLYGKILIQIIESICIVITLYLASSQLRLVFCWLVQDPLDVPNRQFVLISIRRQ